MDGWMDIWVNRWVDVWMDGWMDRCRATTRPFDCTLWSDISTVTKLLGAHTKLCRGSCGSFLSISGGILTCIVNAPAPQGSSQVLSRCVQLNQIGALSDFRGNNIPPGIRNWCKLPKQLRHYVQYAISVFAHFSLNDYTACMLISFFFNIKSLLLCFTDLGL